MLWCCSKASHVRGQDTKTRRPRRAEPTPCRGGVATNLCKVSVAVNTWLFCSAGTHVGRKSFWKKKVWFQPISAPNNVCCDSQGKLNVLPHVLVYIFSTRRLIIEKQRFCDCEKIKLPWKILKALLLCWTCLKKHTDLTPSWPFVVLRNNLWPSATLQPATRGRMKYS